MKTKAKEDTIPHDLEVKTPTYNLPSQEFNMHLILLFKVEFFHMHTFV